MFTVDSLAFAAIFPASLKKTNEKARLMYAVILTGGKQYRVTAGDIIDVEKLEGAAGDTVKIDTILSLSGDKIMIGTPSVAGAVVEAQLLGQNKNDKVLIFKKKRRHNYRRKNGHRQQVTTLHILSISLNGTKLVSKDARALKASPVAPVAKEKAPKAAPAAKKPAAAKAAAPKKPAAKKAAK
jgi:large subunit ribosomal protein L21